MEVVNIKQLLNSVGYKKVVVIDDIIFKRIENIEGFNDAVDEIMIYNVEAAELLSKIGEMNILEFEEEYSNSVEPEKEIFEMLNKKIYIDQNQEIYEDTYKKILKDFTNDDIITYERGESFISNTTPIDANTLVFIDVNFNDDNYKTFQSIVKHVCENSGPINFVIYSSEPFDLMDFDKTKLTLIKYLNESFVKANSWLTYSFSFLSKNSVNLEVDLIKEIRKNYKLKYLNKVKESTNTFIQKLEKEFFNIQNYEEKRHHFYLSEGMNSSEILEEIICRKFESSLSKCRDSGIFEEINRCTNIYYDYLNNHFNEEVSFKQKAGRFLNEYSALNDVVKNNGLPYSHFDENLDVRKGDLIKIGSRHFLIITQDCDMVIRYGTSSNNIAHLVPVKLKKLNENNDISFVVKCALKEVIREHSKLEELDRVIKYVPRDIVDEISNYIVEFRSISVEDFKVINKNTINHKINMYDTSGEGYYLDINTRSFTKEIQLPVIFLNYKIHSDKLENIRFSTKQEILKITEDYCEVYENYLKNLFDPTNSNTISIERVGSVSQYTIEYIMNEWINHKTRTAFNNLPSDL